ncbi:MAG: putative motility protein [Xanthobacteraceae bacterium]
MDVAALALALVSAQQGQFQAAVATKVLKSQATQDASVLQILNAGNPLANVAAGVGQNLDVSA